MKVKYLIIAAIFLCQNLVIYAQAIDQSKMERDLKIAEDVISSLVKGESNDGRFYAASPKASYIPGFGVMIDINSSGKFYSNNFDESYNFSFSFDEEDFQINVNDMVDEMVELEMKAEMLARQAEEIERHSEIVARENERMAREHQRALEEKERELERQMERLEREQERAEREQERREDERQRIEQREIDRIVVESATDDDEYTYRYTYSRSDNKDHGEDRVFVYAKKDYEKEFEDLKPLYKKVMTTFLTDYADLIGQLKDKEQIMLVAKDSPRGYGLIYSNSDEGGKYSAATSRINVADYKAGRISRSTFEDRINYVESKGTEKKSADLELFSSILQRLYKTDLATTYYTSTPISYERLKSFGVIYKMKMYSSISMGRDNYKMPTQNKSHLSRQERDKKVEELYPQFVSEFKQNILDYGKTIKSLDDDESILFQVWITECNSCDIPQNINILVSNKTLMDLDTGKITQSQALQQIQIKEAL